MDKSFPMKRFRYKNKKAEQFMKINRINCS